MKPRPQITPKCLVYDARMVFQARAVLGDVMRAEAGKSGPTARTERTRRAATRIFNQYWPVRPKRVP